MHAGWKSQTCWVAGLTVLSAVPLLAPEQHSPNLTSERWPAHWIASLDGPRREFGVYYFRKAFELAAVPNHFIIHASADNRYELFVNGARVVEGPARGDLDHWRYETLDIAASLHPGKNLFAAIVWNFAELAPMAQMTNETGLIVQGDTAAESAVNTNKTWRCLKDTAWEMIPRDPRKVGGYFVVGPGEKVDGTKLPWGWTSLDYDDSTWKLADEISEGGPRGIQDSPSRWMLVARTIPLMEAREERLQRVVRASGVIVPDGFLDGHASIRIPAYTRATVLFDQTYLTTGYPELTVSGGRGAVAILTYAEALIAGQSKGNRNETKGKEIRGLEDHFLLDGGAHRTYRPLWWRTWRYFQVDLATADEPLVLENIASEFTAYPFQTRATFTSDDPTLAKIWEVGWRTARLCAHETYMDCPYYEQLQYGGDTRIQALISLSLTDDDRLVKNAIEQLNESRTPDGLTQSRYPSFLPQYIPPFSLLWIGMMRDLWWYRGDAEFLRGFLPNARDVLGWFESRLTSTGLLGRLEWWDFVDWNNDFADGVPPQEPDGQSSILSLQFALGLESAADLEEDFGDRAAAAQDRKLAAEITAAVHRTCWAPGRHLIADTPSHKHFSQHANILAVLAGAIPPDDQPGVMRTALSDSSLTQCSYYFRFYLCSAMKKAGLADEYLQQLGPWKHMLELGLTTWAETPEPTRSDCHAWSAHPNFDLLATVAGIEPAAPGFAQVVIAPHLGPLRSVEATLPHALGEIRVAYRRQGDHLDADISLPPKVNGWLVWKASKIALHGGSQRVSL